MQFGSFVRIGRYIVEVLREHFQLIKRPLRQKKVKNATTKADPYGMTNKGASNDKSEKERFILRPANSSCAQLIHPAPG